MQKLRPYLMTGVMIGGWALGAVAAEPPRVVLPAIWPQWRGPTRDGQVHDARWPERLDERSLKLSWRVKLEPSYSGPIVSPELVFVTETREKSTEVVRALDRKSGKELWQTSWPGALSVPFFAKSNGDWIRSTPAWDGELLFVAGMRDVLVCLDGSSGKEQWRVDFPVRDKSPVPAFGFVCSPLVDEDGVYVQAGGAFQKLNKRNGTTIWTALRDEGGMMGSAFSSPTFATLHGRRQVVVQTRTRLAGVDPETGRMLWSQDVPAFRGMNILTPSMVGESVFTSTYGGKSFLFGPPAKGAESVETLWTNRVQGYMSTPVIIDGHAYLHLRNQRLTCLDLKTGREKWTTAPFGKYWSMVANGDKILGLDEQGTLFLIRANPERFEQLDSRRIAESDTWAHLAVCGDELFIRELNAIAAYRWVAAP